MKDKSSLNWEVSVGVTFASFMSAVTLFFTGMVISQFSSFGPTIKVPILFLLVSTFSFIFSAAIYSNAGVEITNEKLTRVNKYLVYANNIFEFLGLHLLILATPLVIGAVTQDDFLRIATLVVAILGLAFYSISDFSILHKEVKSKTNKFILVCLLVFSSGGLYAVQFSSSSEELFLYNLIGCLVLLFNIALAIFFNTQSKQYEKLQF